MLHFQSLLGTASACQPIDFDILNLGPKLNTTQSSDLIKSITNDDIKNALFSIGDDKSRGPDG